MTDEDDEDTDASKESMYACKGGEKEVDRKSRGESSVSVDAEERRVIIVAILDLDVAVPNLDLNFVKTASRWI